ncbi:hypothetical protein ISN45_Aa04g014100 [Arabidopsis thaliana x Arabidopsis arenosa]|uniref:Transmembrane protein n=1 Tax=Arabidopsis thaliana x Arabidopsis arenosa TaxID=1240361 RepID=A0A8T2A626_9BRAS|nr:hypothetical protein ISN45_Aa04g014100 [Arabidopsis thaliana x Arabidopsis arenosa]
MMRSGQDKRREEEDDIVNEMVVVMMRLGDNGGLRGGEKQVEEGDGKLSFSFFLISFAFSLFFCVAVVRWRRRCGERSWFGELRPWFGGGGHSAVCDSAWREELRLVRWRARSIGSVERETWSFSRRTLGSVKTCLTILTMDREWLGMSGDVANQGAYYGMNDEFGLSIEDFGGRDVERHAYVVRVVRSELGRQLAQLRERQSVRSSARLDQVRLDVVRRERPLDSPEVAPSRRALVVRSCLFLDRLRCPSCRLDLPGTSMSFVRRKTPNLPHGGRQLSVPRL